MRRIAISLLQACFLLAMGGLPLSAQKLPATPSGATAYEINVNSGPYALGSCFQRCPVYGYTGSLRIAAGPCVYGSIPCTPMRP